MIQLEPDPAREQRHDELVEADALSRGRSDELRVKAGRASNEDAAVGGHVANSSAYAIDMSDSACDSATMPSTTASKPITAAQQALIERLFAKALQTDSDMYTYRDRIIERLPDAFELVGATAQHSAEEAWRSCYVDRRTERLTRDAGGVCIDILKAMAAEPRCEGYCGERGVRHSKVRYYDDHYDYECGLS